MDRDKTPGLTIQEFIWDLVKYSPYGLKVEIEGFPGPLEIVGVNLRQMTLTTVEGVMIKGKILETKPYLFPLSKLSGPSLERYRELVKNPLSAITAMDELMSLLCGELIDYTGLIKNGFALDATGKGIYGNS